MSTGNRRVKYKSKELCYNVSSTLEDIGSDPISAGRFLGSQSMNTFDSNITKGGVVKEPTQSSTILLGKKRMFLEK